MASYLLVFGLILACGAALALGPDTYLRGGSLKRALSDADHGLKHVISKHDAKRAEVKILALLIALVASISMLIFLLGGFRNYFS